MILVEFDNKNTATKKHWIVDDVFLGYTTAEKASWFVTLDSSVNLANQGILNFNYLTLNNDDDVKHFERMFYAVDVNKAGEYYLHIKKAIPFSLSISSNNADLESEAKLKILGAGVDSGGQSSDKLFIEALDETISVWESLFLPSLGNPIFTPVNSTVVNPDGSTTTTTYTLISTDTYSISAFHRIYRASNNLWNQDGLLIPGVNDDDLPGYYRGDSYVNDRFFNTSIQAGIVDLDNQIDMTNPYTLEIHAALDAGKFATDPVSSSARFANLGHLIERISSLLGYRPEPDGTFKKDKELTRMRTIVNGSQSLDAGKVGVNNFAEEGMVIRRLNNRFDGNGIKADECVVVHDLIQLLAEYQDQLNLALNLQESSAIEIKNKQGTARYPNQLSLMTELLNLAMANQEMVRAALVSSLVAQGQTSELIAALGLPSVTKSLPIQIGDKLEQLPYKGVAPHRSISQEIATCTQNVGIVLGQLI